MSGRDLEGVAIIGMAGRFPGARDVETFWRNLCAGIEAVGTLTDEQLERAGAEPELLQLPSYVRTKAVLEDVDLFDAPFFGFTPREGELMDPQHRLFLECCWEALEDTGHTPEGFEGSIGVFASSLMSTYLLYNLFPHPELLRSAGWLTLRILNDKDFLATRVSYKLNLKGPSVNVQTACSSSLVGCHLACQSLLGQQCDMALVGGVAIGLPQDVGYVYEEGGIYSPDGRCRPFDARANGTLYGSGLGVVALRRLEDAVADGDHVYAVIKGSAVNNDGAVKVGYTAPSVDGQAEVVAAALGFAGIDPDAIGFIEAHGTGTALGDPIEVAALSHVFRESTPRRGFCALGSVKANIGHLDAAAGVASLIKAALAVERGLIPPSVNCDEPNPKIDFPSTPFFVNTTLREWRPQGAPRRAGVSSLGVGGTNAHLVLEQAPAQEPVGPSRAWQLLTLSAGSREGLERAAAAMAERLRSRPDLDLADLAYTLHVGRRAFPHRLAVLCRDARAAASALEAARPVGEPAGDQPRPVVFLFPGQGAQHPGMAAEVYRAEPVFRAELDRCAGILRPLIGCDLRDVLWGEEAAARLAGTGLVQPALFAVEYSLAQLWMSWGVSPESMVGHSVGEYVAACLAGVFLLEDALSLVAARGRLMQSMPSGAMMGVPLPEEEVRPLLGTRLSLAAVNGEASCTVSGPGEDVEEMRRRLAGRGIEGRRLHTSHAFHSAMMDPVLAVFAERVRAVRPAAPRLRWLSNLSGSWIRPEEAEDPWYWARHLRGTVRFSAAVQELLQVPGRLFLEVGPGQTLTRLVRRHRAGERVPPAVPSLPHPRDAQGDLQVLTGALGRLWEAGAAVDWSAFHQSERRRRVSLPTYPFARRRYWIDPPQAMPRREEATLATVAAFPQAAHERPAMESDYAAPRTVLEQSLVDIWRELLGISRIGVDDDFFELGGDSLLATRVTSRVRDSLGVELRLQEILDTRTVAALAARLAARSGAEAAPAGVIPPAPGGAAPLSFSQRRLWFLDHVEPGNAAYNLYSGVRLRGPLEVPTAAASLREIVRRHTVLRATYALAGDEPVQTVQEGCELRIPLVDLSALGEGGREKEVRRLAARELLRPFDLAAAPLLRAALLRLGAREHVLLLSVHHICFDGWSWGVLFGEMAAHYEAFAASRPSLLPPLPVQYADYAVWQRRTLGEERLEESLAYWTARLSGLRPLALPTDRPGRALPGSEGAQQPLRIPADAAEALRALSRQEGCTLYVALLAAFAALLHQLSGQEDVAIGSPVAGRSRSELEGLIGFFVNTLVLRTDLSGDPRFRELLGRVRTAAAADHAHQELPFDRLVTALRTQERREQAPLFRVWFVLHNTPMPSLRLAHLDASTLRVDGGAVRHDLNLSLWDGTPEIPGIMEYRTEIFAAATVARLADRFASLVDRLVQNPDARLSELARDLEEAGRRERLSKRQELKSTSLDRLKQIRRRA